jgi:disulfide bond formation protein DsbB
MSNVILLTAIGIVIIAIALIITVVALFNRASRVQLIRFSREYGLLAIFIISTLSVVTTLFLQYADNLTPCLLCWYQRVFMYPIPFISFIALIKGKRLADIADYVLTFSVFGAAIALYQHLLQILPSGSLMPCDPTNDCAIRTIFEFGFVSLPFMALVIFLAIVLIVLLGRKD